MDTSYAWISTDNATSIAIRMHELGYDVYLGIFLMVKKLGNFRGTTGHYKQNYDKVHEKFSINNPEYWDFNLDDLTLDIGTNIKVFFNPKVENKKNKEIGAI